MSCSNCYNGCTEIVSDKCVKYTGVDVPVLGIQTGDSLSYVEQALITFLTSTLDGTGIKIDIPESILCPIVSGFLPTCGDITAVDLFETLIKTACNLQLQITTLSNSINVIEAPYTIDCLTGVTSTSGTHDILQAVITKLCDVSADLVALALDLDTNYVKLADLNDLIQAYLDSIAPPTNKAYRTMVPYVAYEYYGPLSNFPTNADDLSTTGQGTGYWEKVYLCNGSNGTPDKRGRVAVGVIQGVGGGALNPNVDPTFPGNPNYTIGMLQGTNTITLTTNQIPSHTHLNTLVFNNPDHTHFTVGGNTSNALITSSTSIANSAALGGNSSYTLTQGAVPATAGLTSPSKSNLTINYTNVAAGGGLSHNNIQPVIAAYYIMYIP